MVLWNEEAESGRWELYGRDFQTREEAEAFVRSKGIEVKPEEDDTAGETDTEGDVAVDLLAGMAYAKAEHWADAARAFESVIRKDPAEAQARHYLGVCVLPARPIRGRSAGA
jgi:hypothetical protein